MGKKSFQKGGGRGVRGGKRVTPPVLRDNFSLEATIVRPRDTGDEGERESIVTRGSKTPADTGNE